ncbi:hypothetical protein [Mumia sp. DW29H23]|uniref:hypothetical protein n=1 Tax=Mumia sp. DW29H23 TaxID=3421241 RepID=UPI003D68D9F7
MALPWVRLDSHIASHDKVLALLADPSSKRWQAAFSYVSALGWSGSQGTEGQIPATALPFVHGTTVTARLLVKHQLWDEVGPGQGWVIRNYLERQMSNEAFEALQSRRQMGAEKGGCRKNHGPDCWQNGRCTRAA